MQRKLSGFEALAWGGGRSMIHFGFCARIKGSLSVDQLREALAKVRQKHPMLAVRLFMTDPHTMWCTTEGVPDFPLQVLPRSSDDDWKQALNLDYDTLFDGDSGPLVRFTLLQSPGVSDLIMFVHHCIYDGLSSCYVLRDLLTFLARPETPVEPFEMLPGLYDLLPEQTVAEYVDPPPPPPAADQPDPHFTPQEREFRILTWKLPADMTAAIVQRCRAEGTTVHSALCTALMYSFADLKVMREGTVRTVSSPVSLRNNLNRPVGETAGLFINPLCLCTLDYRPDRAFWDVAREFKVRLNAAKAEPSILTLIIGGQRWTSAVPYAEILPGFLKGLGGPTPYDLSVTNLGVLPLPTTYGPYQLDALYGPVVNLGNYECVTGVLTLGGEMFLTQTHRNLLMNQQTSEQIGEQTIQRLADAVR